ncbi:hypothetical protein [Saccharothrix xinjiangensis]|uniref:Uncharacterized protein n=1 Tax=Saccharothrix xinjiangensis TaxID=204798 RepID=A0ABV9YI21_9PSEU
MIRRPAEQPGAHPEGFRQVGAASNGAVHGPRPVPSATITEHGRPGTTTCRPSP